MSRCTWAPSALIAPRTVLPSTAIATSVVSSTSAPAALGLPVASSEKPSIYIVCAGQKVRSTSSVWVCEGRLQRRELRKRVDRWYFGAYYREAFWRGWCYVVHVVSCDSGDSQVV